ncbi:hypothetical protein K461DRAFT_279789 [Myriangium duriaei CBS 260.36]|uniref:PHD-type domain-containing protein n=1 Tax=Myriangium duriaei CBS 260.36 TaxID=1168546 RepID=A0A9P4MFF2_9PEZI|nr:hypothetical protein K461DRAFT_279789 [Myriangium duriaei CBS 260.36]
MPDFSTISQPSQIDPDVSSTLTDFLAYTEHLPSAVIRSMSLIGEQDRIASDMQQRVHDMLSMYSRLPTLKGAQDVPDSDTLRRDISQAFERLEKARRMSQAESVRMLDMVRKDKTRLEVITRKLKAMPMPPSRDPTPEPVSSPQMRKAQPLSEKRAAHRTGSAPRVRGRKIMVPGEVLPPPNPDSPPPSDVSDDESIRSSPPPERKLHKSVGRPRTPKPPKEKKEKKEKTPRPPRMRTPGHPGTNVHSSVAGISTSNALLKLIEPPPDAVPGSKWLPWKRITEFELAKLRKRMKKNAIWLPSPAMRNRELKLLGRGQQAMEIARQVAEETSTPFIDEYGPDWRDPTSTAPTTALLLEEVPDTLAPDAAAADEDDALMNRGMRLNEAKKRKRERLAEERLAEEAAIAAQLHSEAASSLAPEPPTLTTHIAPPSPSPKKRKRDPTPLPPLQEKEKKDDPSPQAKKLKLSLPLPSPTTTTATEAKDSKPRITLKRSKAASAEPPARRSLRRGSNASLPGRAGSVDSRPEPTPTMTTSTTRAGRKRRPAPGLITADEDGRAKVSVGKRKAAPRKKRGRPSGEGKEDGKEVEGEEVEGEGEGVDPDEPRYCTCGDVSWGTMIACDAEDCDKEWFHLACVELDDMPPRRTRWYCPECRKRLKKGVGTNGIVRP